MAFNLAAFFVLVLGVQLLCAEEKVSVEKPRLQFAADGPSLLTHQWEGIRYEKAIRDQKTSAGVPRLLARE